MPPTAGLPSSCTCKKQHDPTMPFKSLCGALLVSSIAAAGRPCSLGIQAHVYPLLGSHPVAPARSDRSSLALKHSEQGTASQLCSSCWEGPAAWAFKRISLHSLLIPPTAGLPSSATCTSSRCTSLTADIRVMSGQFLCSAWSRTLFFLHVGGLPT